MQITPNVRIISINSQYGYLFNFYTLLPDRTQALRQFEWLNTTLQKANEADEKVIILAHIPMGRWDMLIWWSEMYHQIVSLYAEIIVGQFTGHTHGDSFEVMRDFQTDSTPVNTIYIAPSVTTFWDINPSFRIYELDRVSWQVKNYIQYHMNITRANEEGKPTWEIYYDALSNYDIPDCSPQSWQSVSDRLRTDSKFASMYQNTQFTGRFGMQPCNDLCRLTRYYALVMGIFIRTSHCETSSATFAQYNKCLGV